MSATLAQVIADALTLSLKEREQLADRLLESITTADDGVPVGASWTEIKRRIEEAESGAATISAEDVFAKLRKG